MVSTTSASDPDGGTAETTGEPVLMLTKKKEAHPQHEDKTADSRL